MATGCLSTPRAPPIPGVESFDGATYHTGAWPHEGVDFTGKRVAVIGTGSSGIQSIPQIAKQAAHVTVFQRTANFSVPANNTPLTEKDIEDFWKMYPAYIGMVKGPGMGFGGNPANALAATPEERQQRYEEFWGVGGAGFLAAWGGIITDIEVNDEAAEFVRGKIGRDREGPEGRRGAEAPRPPDRHQAHLRRYRLLRDLQPPERDAGEPQGDADREGRAARGAHLGRHLRGRRHRLRHRVRRDDRHAAGHRHRRASGGGR